MISLPAIRIEGGLLGPDVIEHLLNGDLPGQRPADFGVDGRRNLIDEIAAVFADSRKLWEVFQNRLQRLPENDVGTTVTRDAWAIPFFGLLGIEARYNQRAYEVDGMTFAISHRMGEPEDSPPVHIVGARQELGRVPISGRPRLAPHSLVQEYLNRTEHLWSIVTNGSTLRLLRDSTFIRRQAYIEFDLQSIIVEQRFNDFAALYRLIHRTRFPHALPDARHCLLEQYYQHSVEQGGRVREHLRDGVEECIKRLANGFLRHPSNDDLRRKTSPQCVEPDRIVPENLYRQLLRLIYRFLFLLVSEDRGLLSPSHIYRDHYGIGRLRRLIENRASFTDHDDVWRSLQVLWKVLADEKLASILELPPLNGELFEWQDLDACFISNRDLLEAFWYLAWYQESQSAPPRRVNYSALDVEELGSVYESLLEFHPAVDIGAFGNPEFKLITGSERKTTGSYYTPPQLVNELIQSALEPVMKERLEEAERMASGEWGGVPIQIRERFTNEDFQRLSGLGGLAAGDTDHQARVQADEQLSAERTLRADKPDAPSSGFDSDQHRGRLGEALHGGVHPVPPSGERQQSGTGNPFDPEHRGESLLSGRNSATTDGTGDPGQAASQSRTKSPAQKEIAIAWAKTPLTIRYSLLAQHALLSIRVCDPACGSGHFLLAAARRLGKELARLRTGEDEPAPERVREATRDVISHCIYGVDKNPLAVDLCRVALWLESHTGGKPLTFLDHRIRCGDSLIGVFDLKVLKEGIPDKAFEPLEGDDKTAARTFAQRNRDERKGQEDLFGRNIEFPLNEFSAHSYEIDAIADDSPDTIRRKKQLFEKSHDDPAWQRYKRACDLWTAAFFQPLKPDSVPITSGALADHLNGRPIDARVMGLATLYSHQQAFFHWPLEFPEVFAAGEHPESEGSHSGFHVVLSNPPWERIKLQEQEFFAVRDARIANAPTKAARARMIEELPKTSPRLYEEYVAAQRSSQAASMLLRHGGRYPLTGRGDINTYAVFAELSRRLIAKDGRCGIIVPTGIATDDTTKFFFQDMTRSGALVNLFDFENRKGIFPAIDSRMKFSLLTCRGSGKPEPATFVFFALDTDDLKRPEKRFTLTAEEIELLNPNTGNCPIFRSQADAELTKAIYRRVPVLWRERTEDRPEENPWRLSFKTLFHMANDSHHFRTAKELREEGFELEGNIFVKGIANGQGQMESADHSQFATRYLPLYEAKMIHQFDHRWATYEERMVNGEWQVEVRDVTDEEKADPNFVVQPRYWVKEEIVESVIPKYPEPLATALRLKHRPSIQRVLSCWLAGYYLNHKLKPKADRVMDNAVPYSPNKEVATLLAGLSTDELAAQMEREFPLSDEDARRIENELSSPESIATELVDRFSPKWFLGWRNITNTTNERTLITTSFPKTPVGNSLPLLFTTSLAGTERLCLTACMSSVVADYVTRQKVGGTNLNYFYLKQFSILVPENFGGLMPFSNREVTKDWIVSRTLELVYTSHDMVAMAHDVGFQGEPFRWDPDRRFEIRCELDAAFFHLYLPCEANGEWRMANREWAVVDETPEQLAALKEHFPRPRDAVSYILEQFPIVKRKDEEAYGRYRTKERILEIYDAMLEAQRTGKPYKSSLNPPPGHPA